MKYAVIQRGYAIYGVGNSEREAIESAVEWIEDAETADDVLALVEEGNGFNGDFAVVEITDALAEQAERDGSLPWGQLDDGTYCTVDEE